MNIDHYVRVWQEHIRVLAEEIGPRGSTTPEERRAAEYCAQVMTRLGLSPAVEPFTSARSSYRLHFFVALSMVLSFAIYPLAGRISAGVAALVASVGLYSEIMEMLFRDNPLRLLTPEGPSQNVVATVSPRAEHRQDLVLIGHVDTNHTPLIFSSTRWVDFWRIFATTTFASFCMQTVLYIVGTLAQWPWIWPVTTVSGVLGVMLAVFCYQAELTPFSAGANDNATGAGMVLALAGHLQAEPLQHTRVWLVNTGCEEVKHYGATDFFERHRAELHNPFALVFEMLGRDGPAWVTGERVIYPFSFYADPGLIALVERVAARHPEWGAHGTSVSGGNTEMVDPIRAGIPAISFFGIGPEGTRFGYRGPELYWHQVGDTYDKIDPDVLTSTYAFTWAFIQATDERVA